MKRTAIFFISVATILGTWYLMDTKEFTHSLQGPQTTKIEKPARVDLNFVTKKFPPVRQPKRAIASSAPASRPQLVKDIKLSKEKLPLGNSFQLAEDIFTLPAENFKKEMGSILTKDEFQVYFRSTAKNVEAWPVAFHEGRQKFYPISHILHIKGATPELRQKLVQSGLEEYYYQAALKLLSVRTAPSRVLQQYRELTQMGLTVRLEVLKERPVLK